MARIGILGAGRVGSALGKGLSEAGHEVALAHRGEDQAREVAAAADIVVNATPGDSSLTRLAGLRAELDGSILIDISNATLRGPDGLPAELCYPGSSLAEQLQQALPGTRVVKTLNTMLFSVMTDPHSLSAPPTAFLSGEDEAAKQTVAGLLADLGWPQEWIMDLGGIRTARATEATVLFVPHVLRARGLRPYALSLAG